MVCGKRWISIVMERFSQSSPEGLVSWPTLASSLLCCLPLTGWSVGFVTFLQSTMTLLLCTCQEPFRSWEFGKVGKRLHWEKAQMPGPSGGSWCLDRLESLSFLEPCRLLHDSRVLSVLLASGWAKAMSWLWNLRVTEGQYKNDYAVAAVYSLSHVWLFATPQTVACQAPLSMGFPRWKSWSWLPFSSPGDLPDTGIELASPAWQAESSPLSNQGSPRMTVISIYLLSGCSVLGTMAGIYILYILFNVVFPHNFSHRWLLLLIYLFLSMIYSIQNSKGIKIFAVSL